MPRFNAVRGISPAKPNEDRRSKLADGQTAAASAATLYPPSSILIKQTTHTKRQCPIWIAQLTGRVDRKEFTRLSAIAKAGGGYWSSYGPVEIHGFIFFEEAKALAFQTLVNPPPTQMEDGGSKIAVSHPPSSILHPACPCAGTAQPVTITHTPAVPAWRQRLRR